jgi:hypothetical protein
VRVRFDPGDDDAYYETRDALLDELERWLRMPKRARTQVVSDVGVFLDWRYRYSNGVLDQFAHSDVTEFLLEWCPRKVARSGEAAEELCDAVRVYVDFMADTGRLVGGIDRAARLMKLVTDLSPTMREEMDDPANFGMGKTLLEGLKLSGSSEEELQAALNARMDEFNALPFEERKAITHRFFDPASESLESEPYELPFVYIPPTAADVEAAAAAAPLLAQLDALRDYLGADGKALTNKGNLKLADGRALVELLDTGDEMDPQIGDKTFRTSSTSDLPRLNFIVDLAKEAGAVRVHRRRLVPVKAWATRPTVARAAAVFAAIIELGPLELLYSGRIWFLDEMRRVLDDGIVHWLAPLLGDDDTEIPFESFLVWARSVVARQIAPYVPERQEYLDEFAEHDMGRIFEVLDEAGVVRWTDRIELPQRYGRSYWTGGTVALTALGRHVLPDYLDDAGYVLRRGDDIADGDGAALIEAMLSASDTQWEALVAGWQHDRPAVERVQMITEAVAAASGGNTRMMGFVALQMFDIEIVEPLVRELLDTQVAGHAALWLISRGRADAETLSSFIDVAVLVDLFAAQSLENPEELCAMFTNMPDPLGLLEDMWRHPAPRLRSYSMR